MNVMLRQSQGHGEIKQKEHKTYHAKINPKIRFKISHKMLK